ncbi:MAG: hypothetical protein JWM51_400 [Microbacteriaceae bacterium]|nr:hypothetical protein [Microbacteriaceae bacterium]
MQANAVGPAVHLFDTRLHRMSYSAAEPVSANALALSGRSVASQRWSDLVFVHWRVDAAVVAPLLPAGLRPDEFDGSSWVGLIPFVLDRATLFGSPAIPYFGDFVEVNVRLYAVDDLGRRGVVFVSLEASRLASVLAARVAFALPYVWSSTTLELRGDELHFSSRRHLARSATSRIVARRTTDQVHGDPLADFLTARWALFTRVRGRTLYLRNQHEPWALFRAELVRLEDTLLARAGFADLASRPPDSVLYSPGVTTRFGH